MLEPHSLAIKRTLSRTGLQQDSWSQDVLDYSKLPRSSGDGMEHNSEGEILPAQQAAQGQLLKIKSVDIKPVQQQDLAHLTSSSTSRTLDSHLSNNFTNTVINRGLESSEQKNKNKTSQIPCVYSAKKNRFSIEKGEQIVYNKNGIRTADDSLKLSSVTSFKPLFICAKSSMNSENLIPKVGPEANSSENIARNNLSKEKILERSPMCIDSRLVITELEERNSKLVEEKVKMSVQLGVQSKVSDHSL